MAYSSSLSANPSYGTEFGPTGRAPHLQIQNSIWLNSHKTYSAIPDRMNRVSMSSAISLCCESPDSLSSSSSLFSSGHQIRTCVCISGTCGFCVAERQRGQSRWSQTYSLDYQPLTPLSTPSPPPFQAPQVPSFPNILCEYHSCATKFYCQTCNVPVCGECGMISHIGHLTVFLTEAIETTNAQSSIILNDICLGLNAIDDDLESVTAAYSLLENKSKQAAEDVTRCLERLKAATEERQKKLLRDIESAKNTKWELLRQREYNLKSFRAKLTVVASKQKTALESSRATGNPLYLKIANGRACGVTFEIQQARRLMSRIQEDWMAFSASERYMLEVITNFGTLILTNPGSIGDGRILRKHGTYAPVENILPPITLPRSSNPRGRPIPANKHPVIVWPAQPLFSENPPKVKIIGNHIEQPNHPDNLCRPWGVTCDADSNIIVADRSNNRIIIFREDGTCVRRFGLLGTGPGEFNRPAGIAIDERRRIVVADKDNHRIQVLTTSGVFLLEFGKKGTECGQFNYPWDVAVNSACEIVVSDTRNHRIQLFSPEGIFLRKFGMDNAYCGFKMLDSPRGVSFSPEGSVILTDFNAHRILCVDYNFIHARILNCKGEKETVNTFQRPQGIVVDDGGNIVVADSRSYMIKVFDKFGALLKEFGSQGTEIEEVDRPSGVALLPDGRILFVDFGNNRVVIH